MILFTLNITFDFNLETSYLQKSSLLIECNAISQKNSNALAYKRMISIAQQMRLIVWQSIGTC